MAWVQNDWDKRYANRPPPTNAGTDPQLIRLREDGYSNHQIATLTGKRLSEINLALGPHNLRGQ